MLRSIRGVLIGAAALTLLAGCGGAATSSSGSGSTSSTSSTSSGSSSSGSSSSTPSPAAFYKGKTLTVIVPSSPGGGEDAFGRLVAKYIQKPLGVAKVVVVNQPAGGGLTAMNTIYNDKPDGLTIGVGKGPGVVFDNIFNATGVQFKANKFSWLGQPDHEVRVVVAGPAGAGAPSGGYTSFAQIEQMKKKVILLESGVTGADYFGLITEFNALGLPYHMIAAYKGSHEVKAALLRGDGSVTAFGYGSLRTLLKANKVHMLFQDQVTPWSQLPNVPTIVQLGQKYNVSSGNLQALKAVAGILSIGHAFVAPPGIPAARLQFLQQAFKTAVTNPAFVATANKEHRFPKYYTPAQVEQNVQNGLAAASVLQSLSHAK